MNSSFSTPQNTPPNHIPDPQIFPKKWLTLILVSTGIFITCLDSSLISIASPYIASSMGILPQTTQWVVTAYLLCISATLLLFGRIGDLIGGKQVFTAGFLLFALGSGLCSTAPNITILALCRSFQAIGASMLMATGMGIVTENFPPNQRGQALGTTGMAVALGTLSGPMIGGFILSHWNWHTIFYINIFLGIFGFFLSYGFLPSSQYNSNISKSYINIRQKLDLTGFLLFSLGMVSLLLALGQAPSWGYHNPVIISLLMVGIIFLGLFLGWERKCPTPLLDLTLFQNWTFATGIIVAILGYVVTLFVSFWTPFYLERVLVLPPQKIGLIMAAIPLTMGFASPTAGWLSDRIGYQKLTCLGLTLAAIALVLLSLSTSVNSVIFWRLPLTLCLFGAGMSMFNTPNNSSIMGVPPVHKLGITGGMVATARNLGMVMGVTISSSLFAYFFTHYSQLIPLTSCAHEINREVFAFSISRVFQAAAIISLIGATLSVIRARSTKT